jgi:uncharacterized protein (DUF2141 family)
MKLVSACTITAFFLVFICSCHSPEAKDKESPIAISIDSTIVVTDTAQGTSSPDTATSTTALGTSVPLTIIVTNLASPTGPVIVGVYSSKNKFPDPKDQLKQYKFTPHDTQLTAQITDLPVGTYAMAIYQDVNSNGKIDKNLIGIPTEPYAFSKNYKPTVKAPGFKDCCFDYQAKNDTVTMKMIR